MGGLWEPDGADGETVAPVVWRNMPQVLSHVLGGAVSLGRSLAHRLLADPFQFLGDRVVDLPRWASFRRGDQVQQFVAGFVLSWALAMNGRRPVNNS